MKSDRTKPRGKPRAAPARGGPRKPPRAYGDGPPRRASPPRPVRERGDTADPYKPARRPSREFGGREGADERFARTERPRFKERSGGGYGERGGFGDRPRGFTVTLDPDVARVFRGDASVNRALRLVLQLMQVVQGPPPRHDRPQRGYQGTAEARGFTRKPRFDEDDDKVEEVDRAEDEGTA